MQRVSDADDRLATLVDTVREMLDAEDVVGTGRALVRDDLGPNVAVRLDAQRLRDVEAEAERATFTP